MVEHGDPLQSTSTLRFFAALNTCAGNCSECSEQSLRDFQTHNDQVQDECSRRVPVPDPVTGRWERSPPEHSEGSARPAKDPLHEEDPLPQTSNKRATSATAIPAETNPSRGILDELAERFGNLHDSARALASCLQNHDVSRKTKQSMIEAAMCMLHKLLGEASDDLERATPPDTRKSLCSDHAEQTSMFSFRDTE